jgi:hypothetical protein
MKKSLTAAVAVGVALSGASLVSANAAPTHQTTTGSVSVHRCANPPSVDTLTSLDLRKTTVHRGDSNTATVHVTSAGAIDPTGIIMLAIYQSESGTGFDKPLRDGVVHFAMPEHLSVGEYMVRASYVPTECSRWRKSRSPVRHLTVLHAN